jgi:hypothetical protein
MSVSDLERFLGYVRAFELVYLTDAWAALEPHLAQDVGHVVHSEGLLRMDDRGRAAVIEGLRRSVHGMDRRFDARIPELVEGPLVRPDGVWMRFSLRLRRAGLPELHVEGEHVAEYAAGRIVRIEEWIAPGMGERVDAFLTEHDARLRPVGAPAVPVSDPRDARDLEAALLRTLARAYGSAKSRQDVGAALAVCSEDFVLETVSMGLASRDRKEAEQQLALFFHLFPDYRVSLEGMATGEGVVACWGRARLTWRGPFLGFTPTGRSAELPFVSLFPGSNGMLRGERFFFDLASLCEQIGLPLEAARRVVGAGSTQEASA